MTTERELLDVMASALKFSVDSGCGCISCTKMRVALAAYDSYISQQIQCSGVYKILETALGMYQVTHVHAAIRQALKEMDITEEVRKPGADGHDEDCPHYGWSESNYAPHCTCGKREVKESL